MPGKLIAPTHPPPPIASNLPFQTAPPGSQISILISESGDGFSVTATRQYAASVGAAATGSAKVIDALASVSDFNCSQGVCANAAHPIATGRKANLPMMLKSVYTIAK